MYTLQSKLQNTSRKMHTLQDRTWRVGARSRACPGVTAAWARRVLGLQRIQERALVASARLYVAGEVMSLRYRRRGGPDFHRWYQIRQVGAMERLHA